MRNLLHVGLFFAADCLVWVFSVLSSIKLASIITNDRYLGFMESVNRTELVMVEQILFIAGATAVVLGIWYAFYWVFTRGLGLLVGLLPGKRILEQVLDKIAEKVAEDRFK